MYVCRKQCAPRQAERARITSAEGAKRESGKKASVGGKKERDLFSVGGKDSVASVGVFVSVDQTFATIRRERNKPAESPLSADPID